MRIFKYTVACLTMALAFAVIGCRQASPVTPPLVIETQTVPVFSDPSGAEVTVDGISKGLTPISLILERNKDHMVVVTKGGYKPLAIPVAKNLNPQDLAVKSVLRMTDRSLTNDAKNPFEELKVSEVTGRGYQLQPQVINVILQPEKSMATDGAEKMLLPQS